MSGETRQVMEAEGGSQRNFEHEQNIEQKDDLNYCMHMHNYPERTYA